MRARKLLRLFSADRRLVIRSLLVLGLVRLGIRLLPFDTLCWLVSRRRWWTRSSKEPHRATLTRVGRAVTIASRYAHASCLVQALTAVALLRRMHQPACLRIGVSKGQQGDLRAHAWVESHGSIVIGNLADLSRFTPMSSLKHYS
jgi:hypothetical protein